jgi:hypothetical protein
MEDKKWSWDCMVWRLENASLENVVRRSCFEAKKALKYVGLGFI